MQLSVCAINSNKLLYFLKNNLGGLTVCHNQSALSQGQDDTVQINLLKRPC